MPNRKPLRSSLDSGLREAVRDFWGQRSTQKLAQEARGKTDAGERRAVTGGKQCLGFANLVRDLIVAAGIPDTEIFYPRHPHGSGKTVQETRVGATELPGFFRATKNWDLVVVSRKTLVLAVEFKSHVGPSFGNNFNNRTEEAIGNAVDLWTAFREGAFALNASPWLGFFMLLEDCEQSVTPVRVNAPHFSVFPEFENASYLKRYELLCQKLVRERHYNSACLLTSPRSTGLQGDFAEPNPELAFSEFVHSLVGHVRAFNFRS